MAIDLSGEEAGPWNPGIVSQLPTALRPLCTIFRPEHVFTSLDSAIELQLLTGLPLGELVAFRPQRLVLHEVLVRVTADFSVPDGSRIEDLGINFREITRRLLARHLDPRMDAIVTAFDGVRRQLADAIHAGLSDVVAGAAPSAVTSSPSSLSRLVGRITRRREERHIPAKDTGWGLSEIAECERRAATATDEIRGVSYRCLARVMSALFTVYGQAWGTREAIVSLATDMASNIHGSEVIGQMVESFLRQGARAEGYELLPRQERPMVINTKGPSASGKSTLRPLQKRLAGAIGVRWSDFALISPDIWRKQLLDYRSLGGAYKYAGALTSEELQIVDQKLDRYMATKHLRGEMPHLLIDRFRFDSFAADSDEAGSNLLTRFGHSVYLFFMITPPELLVERAWKRGLEVGRYKAVDDTLAHSVEAYTGMPNVFFTWVRRNDKRIHFEFLDNSVRFGELPRTVAFGSNDTFHVLDVAGMLNIERYGRVNIDATTPHSLYPDRRLLAPEHNVRFLKRCIDEFRDVIFADQATGRVYMRIAAGSPVRVDREALQIALADPNVRASVQAVAPGALDGSVATSAQAEYLVELRDKADSPTTIGQWGSHDQGA
jgi:hypothetical protein